MVEYMSRDKLFKAVEQKYPQKKKEPPVEEYEYPEVQEAKPKVKTKKVGDNNDSA